MGPVLAGVGLGLAAAQRRLRRDPASADRLLEELRTEGSAARMESDAGTVAAPAELDDGDLAGALWVLAAGLAFASGLDVGVDASDSGRWTRGARWRRTTSPGRRC